MASNDNDEVGLTTELWKPSDFLEVQENQAVQTAKFLHANRVRLLRHSERASVDDAIALAESIITLSGYGQKQPALQASQIAADVEILTDRLAIELENLI